MAIERIERIRRYEADEGDAARQDGLSVDDERASDGEVAARRREAVALVERAACVIESEPDVAAWQLEKALCRMIELWLARYGNDIPAHDKALAVIEREDPHVALQLRLARRASDVRVRLRHCRAMLVLVERSDVGLEPADAGCAARRFEARRQRLGHDDNSSDDE
jgi:hypothetical protein